MAVTDWVFCLELTASPWPAAVGWLSVPGRNPSQLLHGRDFLFYSLQLFYHIQVQYSGQLDIVARKWQPKVAIISEEHCTSLKSGL